MKRRGHEIAVPGSRLVLSLLMILAGTTARAATFIVDSAGDGNDLTINGTCQAAGNVCTLRAAIQEANATAAADVIQFNIPGAGVHTLSPGSDYPTITRPVTIDGATQPGYSGTPLIEIDGTSVMPPGTHHAIYLTTNSNGSVIRGLAIGNFTGRAVTLINSSGHTVVGNHLGVNAAGTAARATQVGVFIQDSPNNVVGGTTAADRNVISGNSVDGIQMVGPASTGNVVRGNYVGLNAAGNAAIPNANQGVALFAGVTNNTIGGTAAGAGNVISGNGLSGVGISQSGTSGNFVQGNIIGLNAAGNAAIGNGLFGVYLQTPAGSSTVGGTVAGARNVISGNGSNGITVTNNNNTIQRNYIGTDVTGTVDLGNVQHGIQILGGADNNLVGGSVANGNVLSGNNLNGVDIVNAGTTGNRVSGNIIGLDATGTVDVGNTAFGVAIAQGASGNIIGEAGAGNVISGNDQAGVRIVDGGTNNNLVQLNYIGLDITGTLARPNAAEGVIMDAGGAATGNRIGGTSLGNVISGNTGDGIEVRNAMTGTLILGNRIGTNAAGTGGVPNGGHGVYFVGGASGNTVGGTALTDRNLISGNAGQGVRVDGAGTNGNVIQGNFIGTDAAGTAGIGNTSGGIAVTNGAASTTIGGAVVGAGNVIAFNGVDGVNLAAAAGTGNVIARNRIHSNGGLGIDLLNNGPTPNDVGDGDNGPNNLQNYPVLSGAASVGGVLYVAGSLNSAANTTYRVEFFVNTAAVGQDGTGFGEGEVYLGSSNVTTDGSGNVVFGVTFGTAVAVGDFVTVTATDPSNNTSEFAANVTVVGDLVVTTTADVVDGDTTSVTTLIATPGTDNRISLREAIQATNATAGLDTIRFGIPVADAGHYYYRDDSTASSLSPAVTTTREEALITDFDPDYPNTAFSWFVIRVQLAASALDTITDPVILDGYTQPGAQANTVAAPAVSDAVLKIVIDGSLLGSGDGLNVISGGSTLRGLVVQQFPGRGIRMGTAGGNTLEGCYVGTDPTGTLGAGNTNHAVRIVGGSNGNTIGGTTPGARNLVSGGLSHGIYVAGADSNIIRGNFVGTDVTGAAALGNGIDGVYIDGGSANVIGGTVAGAGNVISGNGDDGLFIGNSATASVVQGNYIGVDATGTGALGNLTHGISLGPFAASVTIGGTAAGAANVIAHNSAKGIRTGPDTGSDNAFLGNAIYSNGGVGIDLSGDNVTPNDPGDPDGGPNDLMNFPIITAVYEHSGNLTAFFDLDVPNGDYRIEFFKNPSGADASGNGEGEVYAGSTNVSHPGGGPANYGGTFLGAVGDVVTATATRCVDLSSCNAFESTSEFSNAFTATTAVKLTSFAAVARDGAVDLFWETGSELKNLGFHLYRGVDGSSYERLTDAVIPGLGSSPMGARYSYRDEGLDNGVTYYYLVEDIETTGRTTRHGPVTATPQEGLDDTEDDDDDASAARITIGDPKANSLEVVRRTRDELLLVLETHGFYGEPQEDGSVRLTVPGFEAIAETNAGIEAPEIPVKRTWVDAVAGRRVRLASVVESDIEAFRSLIPSEVAAPEVIAGQNGTVRVARPVHRRGRERERGRRARFQGRGLTPSDSARIIDIGFQGDVKKAFVELAPLRWDDKGDRLVLSRRLEVRISFRGRDRDEETVDRVRRRWTSRTQDVLVRLVTKDAGLHAVCFEDVFGRRRRDVPASALRLSRLGEDVPFHIEPRSDRFGPGSVLYFLSDGPDANPYGNEAVYELEQGALGLVMELGEASPSGSAVSAYRHALRLEEDRYYQPALLNAPDLWLWDLILAPDTKRYEFHADELVADQSATLSVLLQGASDFPGVIDHHVRVHVNGTAVGELSWNGKRAERLEAPLLAGVLREGVNTLEIENVGDTGAAYSLLMLDRFEVVYTRRPIARDGRLEGEWRGSGTAELSNLDAGFLLLDTTEARPRWLQGAKLGADGVARARVEAGRRFLAISRGAVRKPELRNVPARRLADTSLGANYIVVAPEVLLPAAAPLLEQRRAQGLVVEGVSLEAVYSEFGFGEARPEAIKEFLSFAYHNWRTPPRYVVLLGDATYDFKNHLAAGATNRVPPLLVQTSYLWTASDPSYAAVNGDDVLPDLAIGRLPASDLDEACSLVGKILAYETGGASIGDAPAVLVADNPDAAGNFVADAESLAASLQSTHEVRKIYLSELGVAAAREAVVRAFDEGASTVSYVGHGGIHLWADENLFDVARMSALSPQAQQPILFTMNCLNGYFHFPYSDSLAEAFLKASERGVVAAFSPSGLSLDAPAHLYHQALITELIHGGHARLGDAVMAAQEAYARTGAFPELLSIYHLFGDPAMGLRH